MSVVTRFQFATYLYLRGYGAIEQNHPPSTTYDFLNRFHAVVAEELSGLKPTVIYIHVNTALLTIDAAAHDAVGPALRAAKEKVDGYFAAAALPSRMGGLCSFGAAHCGELAFGADRFPAAFGELMNSMQRMVEIWDTAGELTKQAVVVLDAPAWEAAKAHLHGVRHVVESGRDFYIL